MSGMSEEGTSPPAPDHHPPQRGTAIAGGVMAAALSIGALWLAVPAESPGDVMSTDLRRALGAAMLLVGAGMGFKARAAWLGEAPAPEGHVRCPSCRAPVRPEQLERAWLAPLRMIASFGTADTREYCFACRLGESVGAVLLVVALVAAQQFVNR